MFRHALLFWKSSLNNVAHWNGFPKSKWKTSSNEGKWVKGNGKMRDGLERGNFLINFYSLLTQASSDNDDGNEGGGKKVWKKVRQLVDRWKMVWERGGKMKIGNLALVFTIFSTWLKGNCFWNFIDINSIKLNSRSIDADIKFAQKKMKKKGWI